jgi:transposase
MEYYVGLDVSLKETSVGVLDSKGKIVRKTKTAS